MHAEDRFSYLLISALWATFLGPDHIKFVDRERLFDVREAAIEWVDDRGVFILMSDDLDTLAQGEGDRHRRDLVDRLRSAWVEGD